MVRAMKTSLVVIDYGSGNLRSAAKAFEKVSLDAGINADIRISADPADLKAASHIVLPGQGAFGDCMAGLINVPGLRDGLEEEILRRQKPFFGICVGMQLMAAQGLEGGEYRGLGWIDGQVRRITPTDPSLKIPHMGWNDLRLEKDHPVMADIKSGDHVYFVHSYQFDAADPAHVLACADYGGPVAAVVARDNMIGAQFHPEKSLETGLAMLSGFLRWKP